MTPRVATKSPSIGRGSLRFAALALAVLAVSLLTGAGLAAPTSVTTRPESPTVCDSVGLIVAGTMPNVCYHLIGAEIEGPTELPTAGPVPTYAIRVRLTVQEPDPLPAIYCFPIVAKYQHGFRLGLLPFGRYLVSTVEYLVPFSRDSTAAPKDSSKLESAFDVRVSPTAECPPVRGCFLFGFAGSGAALGGSCTTVGRPGGTACFDVTLQNEVPVGGLQTNIHIEPKYDSQCDLYPISVEAVGRASKFQVAWTAPQVSIGCMDVRILLFSPDGATIEPGRGPVLHVCYAVKDRTPEGAYRMNFSGTVVADPAGGEIPPCLTFAEITGTICVFKTAGCDLNGDGVSDILDVVLLVHCALAYPGGVDACPDSVKAKADCNSDGRVDIRDVICCVRKILDGGGFGTGGGAPPDSTGTTGIGFTGPARWISPFEGRATIEIVPGMDFAGIQFGIDGSGSSARIREVRPPSLPGGYQVETSLDPDGRNVRVMLYRIISVAVSSGAAFAAQPPIPLEVILEPVAGSTGTGDLELVGARSANGGGQAMATKSTAPTAEVPQSPGAGAPYMSVPAPNPFAVGTEVAYALLTPRRVTLRVYSVSGRLIRTLVDASMPAGTHRAQWDGRDSAGHEAHSGIYFFKFTAGEVERTARVVRLR